MTEYVYATERVPAMQGRKFRNPRFFVEPEPDATVVYLIGQYRHVAAAYQRIGVPVIETTARELRPVALLPAPPVDAEDDSHRWPRFASAFKAGGYDGQHSDGDGS